jgi:acetylornithine deacetylase/succinyl-diaminopimelate desuccinylase-like protein
VQPVIDYLRKQRAAHLEWLHKLCRFPTISTLPEHRGDLRDAAEWLAKLLTGIGLRTELLETPGHPSVYAEYVADPSKPTYLVYGHYDVQPVGPPELWHSDPFTPTASGPWLIARGVADDKGQVLVYVRAAAAWLATQRKLPVNLKFLIEGEEEISSPNLAALIAREQTRLKCDHILISDTGMLADGWPTITYGTRGLVYKEIRLSGPKHDLHSGSFGGSIANPANVLAKVLASLHDDQGRVTIPGFYERVRALDAAERGQFASLQFDEQQYLSDTGSPATVGEVGFSTNERRWARPTCDCNGIYGGFQGAGANTIIPARAGAKVSMRLVPDQRADEISTLFDQAIRARCPETVRLEILNHGGADPYVAPRNSAVMEAAGRALAEAFGRQPAYIREGGSLPILPMFRKLLGADSLMLGFAGPTCNAHGPDEKVSLEDLDRGTEAVALLLGHLGAR